MKRALTLLLCLALTSFGAHAAIGTVDNVPAATLLLPYFEVDLDDGLNGTNTTFRVGNSRNTPTLAHVTLWTDRGVPTYSFDIYLGGYDIEKVDLRLLFNGILPQTSPGASLPGSMSGGHVTFSGCEGVLAQGKLPQATITGLRNAHSGVASTLLGGNCGGSPRNDGHARGYITIDATRSCTSVFPDAEGYFVVGGNGIATNDNILWGSWRMYDRATGTAYGEGLAAIEAGTAHSITDGPGDYTFYGRRIGASGADNRERLPLRWHGRVANSPPFQTTAIVWRDPGAVNAFPCGAEPAGLNTGFILGFDDQENPWTGTGPLLHAGFPLAAQRVNLSDPSQAWTPFQAGFYSYEMDNSPGGDPFGASNQSWVTHLLTTASGMSSALTAWTAESGIGRGGWFDHQMIPAQCTDGIDNDGDGKIDHDDPDCKYSPSGSPYTQTEAPQCSDGINNDPWADADIDYPADPHCVSPGDWFEESNGQCSDGIDNDGDGLVDLGADPSCTSPWGGSESRGPCDNHLDDDGDGKIDYPDDPGCSSLSGMENPQCNDGVDNDSDGEIDYPADAACSSAAGTNEGPACDNGTDDDGDGLIDFPRDPGCASAISNSESPACNDGVDNDGDGFTDYGKKRGNDPGCQFASSTTEAPPCNDGIDNDMDGLTDYPNDPGCADPWTDLGWPKGREGYPCSDGFDNDGDGRTDYPLESGCSKASDVTEGPDCSNAIDDDGDGLADAADPGCASPTDLNEFAGTMTRECSDGIDNDGDGLVDYPADGGCLSAYDNNEYGGTAL